MQNYQSSFAFIFLSTLLLGNFAFVVKENVSCRPHISDINQSVQLHEFGPNGIRGSYNMSLLYPMHPGAVVSVVTKSDSRGSVNLIADDIYVIHVDARILSDELVINTSAGFNLRQQSLWHDVVTLPNPVAKGAKTTTTLVYEANGFRVFINNKEVAFYAHRTDIAPRVLNLQYEHIYKILYLTTTGETNNC